MTAAITAGIPFPKAFSVGVREPWPPKDSDFSSLKHTFNIIDNAGAPLFSTDDLEGAAEAWRTDASELESKVGLVICRRFSAPEELELLLFRFRDAAGLI